MTQTKADDMNVDDVVEEGGKTNGSELPRRAVLAVGAAGLAGVALAACSSGSASSPSLKCCGADWKLRWVCVTVNVGCRVDHDRRGSGRRREVGKGRWHHLACRSAFGRTVRLPQRHLYP